MKTENEQAPPAPNPNKKPRKDRGTRRVSLPGWQVKELERAAEGTGAASLSELLSNWMNAAAIAEEPVTLPPAVQGRLAPAAAATGQSVSDLLLDMEGDFCALLDGCLGRIAGEVDLGHLAVPSLQDRLVEDFRARLKAATEPSPEPPTEEVVDLMGAIKDSLAKGRP